MDINVGPEYEAFRAEVRDFLSTRGHEAPESGDLDYKSERRLAWQKTLIETVMPRAPSRASTAATVQSLTC